MPEGDTIHRAARTLNTALAGRRVTRFETALAALASVDDQSPVAGRTIERVVAAGKNLVIDFSGDLHLRTHMRMNGTWHIYRPGERWRKRRADMRIVIETDEWVAVGFTIPVAEFHDARSLERQEDLLLIGPDLGGETFDTGEAMRRIRARADSEIAEVLLNQRVIAGIGNEYKSEVLFITHLNPFTVVRDIPDEKLSELLRISRKLMLLNIQKRGAGRETRNSLDRSARVWVYNRAGQPCRRCGTRVEFAKQGKDARQTYWCPRCQP